MDTLMGLLDGPKARGAFLLRSVLDPPWSLRIEDRAPLSVVTMIERDAWVLPEGGEPVRLRPGDVALLRGPAPYTVADDPGTPTTVRVGPGQDCTSDGVSVAESLALGVRTWGGGKGPDAAVMLTGTYQADHEIGRRLLACLPALLVRPLGRAAGAGGASGAGAGAGSGGGAGAGTGGGLRTDDVLVGLLAEEIGRSEPGQELVLDRLLDLLVIGVLRTWLARPEAGAPAWYLAQGDPVVGPALRVLHEEVAYPWTVASLAARVGISRAHLARRFTELIGEPPMAYLASWRLALAADLLADPTRTIGWVAGRVGYSSAFALSAAFKRVRGVSPQEHRRLAAAAVPVEAGPPVPGTVVLAG
ncbi:AraC family transcriptional regulator [Kitasatospora sp. NPDC054939]